MEGMWCRHLRFCQPLPFSSCQPTMTANDPNRLHLKELSHSFVQHTDLEPCTGCRQLQSTDRTVRLTSQSAPCLEGLSSWCVCSVRPGESHVSWRMASRQPSLRSSAVAVPLLLCLSSALCDSERLQMQSMKHASNGDETSRSVASI